MGSLHKILCIGIGVVTVANLMHMSSISTPKWKELRAYGEGYEQQGISGEVLEFSGLFESCTPEQYYESECRDFEFDRMPMKYQVVQTLAYLAMVCGLLGVGAAIVLQLIVFTSHSPVSNVTVISATAISTTSCITSAGFDLAIASIYGDRFVKKDNNLSYSFYLCLLAMVLFWCGAILITHASKTINLGFKPEGNGQESVQFSAQGDPAVKVVTSSTSVVEVRDETNGDMNGQ